MEQKPNKTALVVLGMHRSGTSSVAGTLAMLGAQPPKTLLEPNQDNPKGFWESLEIIHLNDRILQAGESWWNDWRKFDERKFSTSLRQAIEDDIVRTMSGEFGDAETVMLKDPRCCRLWSFWAPALETAGYKTLFFLPVRPPIEVARSLLKRNGFCLAEGLALWLRHVLDAERATRGQPRLISLWPDFMADWRGEMARAEKTLGWKSPDLNDESGQAIDSFLVTDMQHQKVEELDPAESHEWADQAFALFQELARSDTPQVHDRLDAFSNLYETANDLYGRALGSVLWIGVEKGPR